MHATARVEFLEGKLCLLLFLRYIQGRKQANCEICTTFHSVLLSLSVCVCLCVSDFEGGPLNIWNIWS